MATPPRRSLLSGPDGLRNWAILVAASLTVMAGATIAPGLPGLQNHLQTGRTPNF